MVDNTNSDKSFDGNMLKKEVNSAGSLKPKSLTDWKNEPTVTDLLYDINQANSSHQAQISKINEWVNLLYADTDKSRIKRGRSGITPKVIRRSVEWRYGSLASAFLNEKKLFSVNAISPKDIPASIQNELVLNFQFNAVINKVKFINDLVRTAVNEGTVIVRVGWETKSRIKERKEPVYQYEQPPYEMVPQLIQTIEQIAQETEQQQLESTEESQTFQSLPPELQESIRASQEYGRPVLAIDTGKVQIIKETVQIKNSPVVKVIPNSSLIIDPSCEGDFEQARFAVYSYITSYSELKQSGLYKNLDDVFDNDFGKISPNDIINMPDDTFQRANLQDLSTFQFKDKARKRIQAYEYWGYYDIDNSGIVQPIVATIVDNTIIRLERSPFPDGKLPFVVIPYLPVKGSVYGEPDGELIKDNQQIIQALTRSMIDIQARSATAQTGIPKGLLDSINARRFANGEDYEYNPSNLIPAQAIFMHTASDIPQSTFAFMQQQYAEAEANTGIKSFQGGIDANAYGQSVAGMSQTVTALTQRESDILFRLSKGLEEVGNKIVAMNAEWLSDEETIAITKTEFVKVKKDELQGDFYLNVSVKSNSEAEGKAQQLTFVAQTLGAEADWGLRKLMLMEICKLYGLDTMLTSIKDYEPQPNELEQQKLQLEIQELQARIAKIQSEAEYFTSRADFVEAQVDDVQATTDQRSLDFLEQQDGTKHARQKEIVEAQALAQNKGKIASEIIKGHNAREQAELAHKSKLRNTLASHDLNLIEQGEKAKYDLEKERLKSINSSGSRLKRNFAPKVDRQSGRTVGRLVPAPHRSNLSYKINEGTPSEPEGL